MTAEMGGFDRIRADLQHRVDQLENKNKILEEENSLLMVLLLIEQIFLFQNLEC